MIRHHIPDRVLQDISYDGVVLSDTFGGKKA